MSESDAQGPGPSVLLLRTWDRGEAEIVRQLLASYGIACRLASELPAGLFPLTVDRFGEVRLYVPEATATEAAAVVAEHRRRAMAVVRDAEGEDAEGDADEDEEPLDPPALRGEEPA